MDSAEGGESNKRPPSHIGWLVLILLGGAFLRIYGLANISPPGLEHDEVANWLIDRAILAGQHAIYFTAAYGHEAGFHYLQALSTALLGDHALALRLPAIFSGVLLIAVQYALTRRLFGSSVALWSAALLAVLFWPVFYSRLGLRAILLPLLSGLALYFWWKGWQLQDRKILSGIRSKAWVWFGMAGLFAGLTLYSYMAARAVPIFFALFILYLAIFHWPRFRKIWPNVLLFGLVLLIIGGPLLLFLQTNPGSEFRITEIDAPLRAMLAGELRPVLENSLKIGGMFGFKGDPLWRQNVAGLPVFGPVLALLFYLGFFLAFWQWRDARYAFLLLWLGTSAVPSIVTVDAPSSIRMINALLVVTIFPVLFMHIIPQLSTKKRQLSTMMAYLLGLLLITTHIWRTSAAVFHTWPENEEVRFVWQAALTDTAAYLDQDSNRRPTAVGGWSPGTMDPVTMALSMRRHDLSLRFFGSDSTAIPVTTIIVPQPASAAASRITRPVIRELAPGLEDLLIDVGSPPQNKGSFIVYEIADTQNLTPDQELLATFDDELQLIGYTVPDGGSICKQGSCRLLTFWRVVRPVQETLRFFLHALDGAGSLIGQIDGLDAPSQYWQPGDIIVQEHFFRIEAGAPADLQLGVYQPDTGQRLLLPSGQDHINLPLK